MTPNVSPGLGDAVALHQAGRLAEAESAYLGILAAEPGHGDALRLLAILRYQLGRHAEALDLVDAALAADPHDAEAHGIRGNILLALQRAEAAMDAYDRSIGLNADDAGVHYNRGCALQQLGRPGEAVAGYDAALALDPAFAQAHCNRGNALLALGRAQGALAAYDRAVELEPGDPGARYDRGNALIRLGRHESALASYDDALRLDPGHVGALCNRGNVLVAVGRAEEALAGLEAAVALQPGHATAHATLGNALLALRRPGEAAERYVAAAALAPDRAEMQVNLGHAWLGLGQPARALASYDAAAALSPGLAEAHFHRGQALKELQRLEDALASYDRVLALDPAHRHALAGAAECAMKLCDWPRLHDLRERLRRGIAAGTSIVPPFLALVCFDDPELQLRCARTWVADQARVRPRPRPRRHSRPGDRIVVAYVSADFRRHATAYLIAELIERHDRGRFEIIAISYGPDDGSDMRARLTRAFDRFIDVAALGDREAALRIASLRVDIAVDLMGHTQYARPGILALRPAPIQAAYLGFPGTTGAAFIDYIVADPTVAPRDRQGCFTERIVHLPGCYQVNDGTRPTAAQIPTREAAGLPAEGFVFCCFNAGWKITPMVFEVWMRLLGAVPGSVLWLLRGDPAAEANLRREAAARGVDPTRLAFADRTAPDAHLARHRLADLFLDTLPYNAHTTASDALWSGLPLLTCRGESFASRVAASLLQATGLGELVTASLDDYERLALTLAADARLLQGFRQRLDSGRTTHPLFDTARFCAGLEAAYTTMWERWRDGQRPRGFDVGP